MVSPKENDLKVDAADIVRLIIGFLTSQGLHESARMLRRESGIGISNNAIIQRDSVAASIRVGEWGAVLRSTFLLENSGGDHNDANGKRNDSGDNCFVSAKIAEQVVLEVAEADKHLTLAYSILKVNRDALDRINEEDTESIGNNDDNEGEEKRRRRSKSKSKSLSSQPFNRITKARALEQKLAEITSNPTRFSNMEERKMVLYGSRTKNKRRESLALLVEKQNEVPLNRLITLIQQSIKWQSYTGQFPLIREAYEDVAEEENSAAPRKRKKRRKRYDLVTGKVADFSVEDGTDSRIGDSDGFDETPRDILSKVKFGKGVVCECAIFFNRGLITSSSDSLIEIWDAECSYKDLNTTDYPYQKNHVMGHIDASILCLALSNDGELLGSGDNEGMVKIWKISDGTCLRKYQAHDASVTALSLSRDASRILTGSESGLCREFGIVNQTLLQVYEGHTSYIHACLYVLDWEKTQTTTLVVTSSGDGTVRVWKNGLAIRIMQPPLDLKAVTSLQQGEKYSVVIDPTKLMAECPAIHSLFVIPGQDSRILIVPRSSTAFLVNLEGTVLQAFSTETKEAIFYAATVTASVVYLASSTNDCLIFSLQTGKLLHTIHNFSLDSTSKTNNDQRIAEISALIHHPFKPSTLAAYSNDKTQKKGLLTVWK